MMSPSNNTILLTGLPRSGTTLVCALLNEFPDTVALAEPLALDRHGDRDRAVNEIDNFIIATRDEALTANEVTSKHLDGVIPDNWVEPPTDSTRLRNVLETRGRINLGKSLSPNFRLVVKHPAEFSALADLLVDRYPLVAVVRHPLAVLAAWQTVNMPVNQGRMPMAEAFNPNLAAMLAAIPDRIQRQVALLGWLLGTYSELPPENVLRYEDLIVAPRSNLARLSPYARDPNRGLTLYEPSSRYPNVELAPLARELMEIQPVIKKFYPNFEETTLHWLDRKRQVDPMWRAV
jgi:hypothetical protein